MITLFHRSIARQNRNYETLSVKYSEAERSINLDGYVDIGFFPPDGDGNQYGGGFCTIFENDFLKFIAEANVRGEQHQFFGDVAVWISGEKFCVNRYDSHAPSCEGVSFTDNDRNLLFLDSIAVIEDTHYRKSIERKIEFSVSERAFLSLTKDNPQLIHSYHPREFEYFVASLLSGLGFGDVRLSRYWNDSGRDIWAIAFEGNLLHTVVVEVKHHHRKAVGIEVVDRLNGVRDRFGFAKGMVVTNSYFTRPAKDAYSSRRDVIALVDYDRLVGLMAESPSWRQTPSGLWLKERHSE